MVPDEPEVPDEPVVPDEPQKKFDLEIEKYIEYIKVNGKDLDLGNEKMTKIAKVEVPQTQLGKTTVEVKYGIKVSNIGEVAGYATEIKDIIPQGLELIEADGWGVKGTELTTTILEKEELQPGESKTLYIVGKCEVTKENIGEKKNIALITKYLNPQGTTDDSQNYSEAVFILAVKTGEVWAWAADALILLIAAILIVITIKVLIKKEPKEENKEDS